MARCPDCNKFVSLDTEQEPEINLDVSESGEVTGSVEIMNACQDCGTEITQASFDVTVEPEKLVDEKGKTLAAWLASLLPEGREAVEFEIENEEGERTSRVEGKGRGARTFYGFVVRFDVKATIEGEPGKYLDIERTFSGSFEDEIQASAMDSMT